MSRSSTDLITSVKIYTPIAGVVLICRLVLGLFPIQAASAAQAAFIQWPVVWIITLLGFPAMHIAHKLGVPGDVTLTQSAKKSVPAFGLGIVSAGLLIAMDLAFTFPKDMNVLGLESIPFYLLGAFLAETTQHLIPIAIWLGLLIYVVFRGRRQTTVFWIGALLISLLEPLSQLGGGYLQGYPVAFYVISGVVFYGINLAQMYLFRRGGFVPMLVYRIGLYSLWHWIWGAYRIGFLF
jgi:hypothetical protein